MNGSWIGIPVVSRQKHYLRAQCQGHHTIDRLEERSVERGRARRSFLKGRERAIVNQTNVGTVLKATMEKLLRQGGAHMGFSEGQAVFVGGRLYCSAPPAVLAVFCWPSRKSSRGRHCWRDCAHGPGPVAWNLSPLFFLSFFFFFFFFPCKVSDDERDCQSRTSQQRTISKMYVWMRVQLC